MTEAPVCRIAADDTVRAWGIKARHAELSFQRLWERVWYEGYPAPDFVYKALAPAQTSKRSSA